MGTLVFNCLFVFLTFYSRNVIIIEATEVSSAGSKIATYPACKEDVARLCGNQALPNDLAVLDCLQNRRSESDVDINKECHSVNFQNSFFKFMNYL